MHPVAHLFEFKADKVLVQGVGGFGQFGSAVGAVGGQNTVLHIAIIGHQNE